MTQTNKPIAGELTTGVLSIQSQTGFAPTAEFQNILNKMPQALADLQSALAGYKNDPVTFLNTNDEDTIEELLKATKEPLAVYREVTSTKTDLRKFLNQESAKVLEAYDQLVNVQQFELLESYSSQTKQMKKDLQNKRMELRWDELEETFTAAVHHYPQIQDLAPELMDFNKFRVINSKLVNGAKQQKPSKTKAKSEIRNIIADYDNSLTLYSQNGHQLSPKYMAILLNLFKANPIQETILKEAPALKQQQNIEEEAIRQREFEAKRAEEARQAQLKALEEQAALIQKAQEEAKLKNDQLKAQALQKEQELLAKRQNDIAQTVTTPQPATKYVDTTAWDKMYPNYMKELRYRNQQNPLHNNDKAKATELYHLMTTIVNRDSAIYKDTQADPTKTLQLVRYILDL